MNTTSVDSYLTDGCGRCDRFQTPSCNVHKWGPGLVQLRELLLDSELVEEMKWGQPTYTLNGKNVLMLSAFNDHYALSFFKGMLLADPEGLLEKPGPATHAARLLKLPSVEAMTTHLEVAQQFIQQAIALERSGARVPKPEGKEPTPDELQAVLEANPRVAAAFEALTPGRRRSYVLHVSNAKQSKTRSARAERCIPKILLGKGFNER